MKKIITVLIFLFTCSILISGCFLRDTSTPEKTLIGHWQTPDKFQAYFDGNKYTTVTASGDTMTMPYKIIKSDKDTFEGSFNYHTAFGWDQNENYFKFSRDKKIVTVTFNDKNVMEGMTVNMGTYHWVYIDGKTHP